MVINGKCWATAIYVVWKKYHKGKSSVYCVLFIIPMELVRIVVIADGSGEPNGGIGCVVCGDS